ncbi:hypothetical protein AX15_003750 [Amanita polypyramis BW_CC]|nr:hypothetical protein AX15_003750 [Amanita polypyramis BW_CC]
MPDVLSDPWVTKQLHFLNGSIPEEVITGVKGNAPRKVKEAPLKAIQSLHKTQRRLYNLPVAGRLTVSEVSITPSLENATKTDCRVFCKININADMLGLDGTLSQGCIALLIDECSAIATTAYSVLEGRLALVGVSQSMNLFFHSTAKL